MPADRRGRVAARRRPGPRGIAGYLAFTAAVAVTTARHAVTPAAAVVPAAATGAGWALTAAATFYALVLGTVLGVPDHIFATTGQYTLLAALAAAGTAATAAAALLQHRHP